MDLTDLLVFLLMGGGIWLWLDSLGARERAVGAARAACASENLLLLDDTVAIKRVGLGRVANGSVRLRRIYDFEYSDTGNDRANGSVVMLGNRPLVINLNLRNVPERPALH